MPTTEPSLAERRMRPLGIFEPSLIGLQGCHRFRIPLFLYPLPSRMAQTREKLKAAPRTEFGSRTSRRLRRDGLVPGVVYSGGSEARAFQVAERDVRNVLAEGAALFDLEIEGAKAVPVVVKEQQHHPVRG